MSLKEIALQYIDAGLCTLPALKAEKRPAIGKRWKEYQYRLPSEAEWKCWFADALCIVCGKISGNLRVIDFDQQGKAFESFREQCSPELFDRLVIERSQSGGYHVVFRTVSEVHADKKLARDANGKTLIETLGEGNLFLCTPTPGYELKQGDFSHIPILQVHEAEYLFELTRGFNEYQKPTPPPPMPKRSAPIQMDGKRPGDALNEDGIGFIKEILQKHGWAYVGQQSEHDELWRRPGKNVGHSAIFHTDTPTFHVFSSDAAPLDATTYSYFNVYAILEHGGDFSAAAKELASLGYGDALSTTSLSGFVTIPPSQKQDTYEEENAAESVPMQMPNAFDDFAVENFDEIKQDHIEDPGLIPEDLLHPPGLVGEIATFCFNTNPVQQQEFALVTGITMVAHLIGQNYQTPDACCSNFYALSIGKSGAGKNRAITFFRSRQIKEIVKSIVGTFSGHAALLRYLQKKTKTLLMVWDEVGGKLEEIVKKPNSPTSQLLDYLTELYSSAESSVSADIKVSDIEAPDVTEPHCSLYGTGTFKSVFKAMTPNLIERGFIGRVNFFFADQNKKKRKMHERLPIPDSILEQVKAWIQKPLALPIPQEQYPSLFQVFPEPTVVTYTEEAKQIFDHFCDQCTIAEENTSEDFQCLWVRSVEEAKKLALIYACSVSMDEPTIDTEAATWACRLSEHLTLRKLYIANHHMAANEQGHLENDILNYVRKKKNQTATQTEITDRFKKGIDPTLRKKAIHNLVITGQLVREKKSVSGTRKTSTVYRIPYKPKAQRSDE
jgi:hypothetical protein